MSKQIGDYYWSQLSMWDFKKKGTIDMFTSTGFHYELCKVTEVVSPRQHKYERVTIGLISDDDLMAMKREPIFNQKVVYGYLVDCGVFITKDMMDDFNKTTMDDYPPMVDDYSGDDNG